jgi:anti-anti-sigma factor
MAMTVRKSTFDEGISVVETEGRLDAAAASQVKADLMSLLAGGKSKTVVDLGGVSYISSSGV